MTTPKPSAPPAVRRIAGKLEEAGHETWAVGGAVRDVLIGVRNGDWDLATRARPEQVRKVFRRTVPIGIEHGTVGVLDGDTLYEVTTFRRDVETDGRHAVVAFSDSIDEDLARRDFTINAIAWHPLREEMRDPYDGLGDMRRRVLRTVGRADERFREDYLRILRAFRFAGRFGLEIERETWSAIRANVSHLTILSAERVRDELMKVLDADPAPARALDLYASSGALSVLYPELDARRRPDAPDADAWSASVAAAAELPRGRGMLRLAALLRDVPREEVAALLIRLRFSNAQVDETAWLAAAEPLPSAVAPESVHRRWLSVHGAQRLTAVARLDLARALAECRRGGAGGADGVRAVTQSWRAGKHVREAAPPLTVGDLAFDGRDLIALGLKPGPHFGRILDALLAWVLEDPARNSKDLLRERALSLAEAERRG